MSPQVATRPAPDLAGAELHVPMLGQDPGTIRKIRPSPCNEACPAGINVKAYVSLIAEERFREALDVVREACPLPGICGRVCDHPCEAVCRRPDEPIAIRALKRFVADLESEHARPPRHPALREGRVAIVGSGPAGLAAAWDLRNAGHAVTVFEASAEPGGMLRQGIAPYRLPREVLDREIDFILSAGIELRTGYRIGRDAGLEELLEKGYQAVLLAVGAQLGKGLPVQGAKEHPGVEDALTFLRRVHAGDRSPVGKRVLVIGGGLTAVEAARTARRLGAEFVDIVYRRSEDELLATEEELEEARAEGVRFQFLVAPIRVLTSGGIVGLECQRVGLGDRDASGRRRPIPIPGSEFVLKADQVLAAVGQAVDLDFLPEWGPGRLVEDARIAVDRDSSMTRLHGVFAAGDMVTGPATVVEAIGAGHRAARSIRSFLARGTPVAVESGPRPREEYELPDPPPPEARRVRPETRTPEPGREFAEVEQALGARQAVAEARRCLHCGPCSECAVCTSTCHRRHLSLRVTTDGRDSSFLVRGALPLLRSMDPGRPIAGHLLPRPGIDPAQEPWAAGLRVEVLPARARILEDRCRACGSCVEVCSFDAITLVEEARRERARIDLVKCRGCNLCTAVCPTVAAVPSMLSAEWWGRRLEDAVAGHAGRTREVLLACERRSHGLDALLSGNGHDFEVIPLRCAGQLTAGMLLGLIAGGARRVHVAGCHQGGCRFGEGAALAIEEVERARAILRLAGPDEDRIASTWSRVGRG